MYCNHCGYNIDEDSTFCLNCGEKVEQDNEENVLVEEKISSTPDDYCTSFNNPTTSNKIVYCSNCSEPMAESDKFCLVCGAPVDEVNGESEGFEQIPNDNADIETSGKKNMWMIVAGIILVLIGVTFGIYIWKNGFISPFREKTPAEDINNLSNTKSSTFSVEGDERNGISSQSDTTALSSEEVEISMINNKSAEKNIQLEAISFKQVDISQYPVVRAYYEIDKNDDVPDQKLKKEDFTIEEDLSGNGSFVQREIRSVTQVKDGVPLAVNLVTDISNSMEIELLEQVKKSMSSFVQSMQYEKGDRAEIMAFNTDVYEMAASSQDAAALIQGISNMQSYGKRSLYDALMVALNRSANKSGVRCVIVCTNGEDTGSTTATSQELIEYAKMFKIPVFLIALGNVQGEEILKGIAEQTGGAYHNISEIGELSAIYNQIYKQLDQLYMIEYISDEAVPAEEVRNISLEYKNAEINDIDVSTQNIRVEIPVADDAGIPVRKTQNVYAKINMSQIENIIFSRTKDANFSFFLKDLQSGMTLGSQNSIEAADSSALVCIPILFTIVDGIHTNEIDIDKAIPFWYTFDGRGYLKKSDHGSKQTIRDLMQYMLLYSDNNAINSLIEYLTFETIENACHKHGFMSVDMQQLISHTVTPTENLVTPKDLLGMLEILDKSSVLGENYLRTYFMIQDSKNRVGAGKFLDFSVNFYNHNAMREKLYNEIAIVSDGQNEYMISFMVSEGKWEDSAAAAADISQYIYESLRR